MQQLISKQVCVQDNCIVAFGECLQSQYTILLLATDL